MYKSNIDEEHGLQWFKDNGGVYTYPRKVDEMYIWDSETAGRIPFYWDFMLEAKEKVEAKVAELDIPWETDDYIPLPEWRPGVEFYRSTIRPTTYSPCTTRTPPIRIPGRCRTPGSTK